MSVLSWNMVRTQDKNRQKNSGAVFRRRIVVDAA